MRQKGVHGFLTGDLVRAVVPSGKKLGIGSFNIQKLTGVVQGISYRHCRVLMHGDGYTYPQKHSLPPRPEGRGLSEN
jgi:hypothetical protein